ALRVQSRYKQFASRSAPNHFGRATARAARRRWFAPQAGTRGQPDDPVVALFTAGATLGSPSFQHLLYARSRYLPSVPPFHAQIGPDLQQLQGARSVRNVPEIPGESGLSA